MTDDLGSTHITAAGLREVTCCGPAVKEFAPRFKYILLRGPNGKEARKPGESPVNSEVLRVRAWALAALTRQKKPLVSSLQIKEVDSACPQWEANDSQVRFGGAITSGLGFSRGQEVCITK